jgi:hypothetical protein
VTETRPYPLTVADILEQIAGPELGCSRCAVTFYVPANLRAHEAEHDPTPVQEEQ